MTRATILPATIVLGLFVGCVFVVVAQRARDRSDPRARALTEWCNEVRAEAVADRERLAAYMVRRQALPRSSSILPDEVELEASAIWLNSSIQRTARDRCAGQLLPEETGGAPGLLRQLDIVLSKIPVRDPNDPDDYLPATDDRFLLIVL